MDVSSAAAVPRPPGRGTAGPSSRPSPAARLLVLAAGSLAALSAVAVVLDQSRYRGWEASLGARAVRATLGYPVDAVRPAQTLFFGYHHAGAAGLMGLKVTVGCSSVLLVTPVLLVTAANLVLGRAGLPRVLAATAAALSLVVAVNVLRLVLIAALVGWWGPESGFGWGHTLFGSLLTLIGLSGAFVLYWAILKFRRPPRSPEGMSHGDA